MSEQRACPRYVAQFDALLATGRREGAGTLADISYTGARLEETSILPELGQKICLYVFVQPVSPFELEGEVVRVDDDGFAIRYAVESDEVRRLVDDVAALVIA